jgi:hypothetical protein
VQGLYQTKSDELKQAKKDANKLHKVIAESRKANYDRHLQVDTACAARLKAAHSSLYPAEDEGQSKGKKRKAPTGDDDEDEDEDDSHDDGGKGIDWYVE